MPTKINNSNRSLYITLAIILGTITLSSLVGVFVLSYNGKEVPDSIISIGSVSTGALGSLFYSTPSK